MHSGAGVCLQYVAPQLLLSLGQNLCERPTTFLGNLACTGKLSSLFTTLSFVNTKNLFEYCSTTPMSRDMAAGTGTLVMVFSCNEMILKLGKGLL